MTYSCHPSFIVIAFEPVIERESEPGREHTDHRGRLPVRRDVPIDDRLVPHYARKFERVFPDYAGIFTATKMEGDIQSRE